MFLLKLLLSNLLIVACVMIGRRMPVLGGLIATMPLISLIVMIWLATDRLGDSGMLMEYTKGVLWGMLPTIAFFSTALLCLRRGAGLPVSLAAAAMVWLGGALLHQYLLR